MLMHFTSGHVTFLAWKFHNPPWNFFPIGLRTPGRRRLGFAPNF